MGRTENQSSETTNITLAMATSTSSNARAAPPQEETTKTTRSMLGAVGNFLFGDHSRHSNQHDHRRHHKHHHHHANSGSFYNHASLERKANRLSALNFDNRVYTLMSVQRQDLLKVLAYNYLASSSSTSPTSSPTLNNYSSNPSTTSSPSDRTSIQRLERQLVNYENIERVELLKLAVWKSQCLLQFPSGKYRCYLDMDEWKEVGWMTQKTQVFGTSTKLVDVVATGVLPFLNGLMTTSTATTSTTGRAGGGGARSARSRSRSRARGNGGSSTAAASAALTSPTTESNVARSAHAKSSASNKRKRGLDDGDDDDDRDGHKDEEGHHANDHTASRHHEQHD